jgi:hypothetical protein
LLEAEKELTRRSDELARRRQALPWVQIDKEYRFETDEGSASLKDLFRGCSQLGVALAAIEMQQPALARGVPIAVAVVVLIAGSLQFTVWKARHLACCREASGRGRTLPADVGVFGDDRGCWRGQVAGFCAQIPG